MKNVFSGRALTGASFFRFAFNRLTGQETVPLRSSNDPAVVVLGACVALAVLAASHQTAFGQTAASAFTKPAQSGQSLGSPDFKPTPERPVGWRGDWTGRFPGATPPREWSRRVKGITTEIKYQAGQPSGEAGSDSRPLEYFTIKEWLVAGPYAMEDPAKDFEKDFLGGEDKVQPDADAKEHLPILGDVNEVRLAYAEGALGLHDRIRFKNPDCRRDTVFGDAKSHTVLTTVGRVFFNDIWPPALGFVNKLVDKAMLGSLIWHCHRRAGWMS